MMSGPRRETLLAVALTLGLVFPCPAGDEHSALRFTDTTRKSGIRVELTCGEKPSREIVEVNGGGVAFLD